MQSPSEEPYVDSFFLPKGILDPDDDDDDDERSLPAGHDHHAGDLLSSSDFVPHLTTWSSQQEFARHSLVESIKSPSLRDNVHGDSALSPIVFKSVASDCRPATPPPPYAAVGSTTTRIFLGDHDGHHVKLGNDTSSPRALYDVSPPPSSGGTRIVKPALSSPSLPPGLKRSVRLPSSVRLPNSEEPSTPSHRRVRDGAFRKQISSPRQTPSVLEQVETAETKKSYASVVVAHTNTNTTTPVRNKPGGTIKHPTGKPVPPATSSIPSPRSSLSSSRGMAARRGESHKRTSSSNPSESSQVLSSPTAPTVVDGDTGVIGTDSNEEWNKDETYSSRLLSTDPDEQHCWSPETTTELIGNDASNLEQERSQASQVTPDLDDLTMEVSRESDRGSQTALDGSRRSPKLSHAEAIVAVASCESGNFLIDFKELSSSFSPATLMFYIRSATAALFRIKCHIVLAFSHIIQSALVVYNLVVSTTGKCIAFTVALFVTAAKLIILFALAMASISRFAVAEIGQGSGSSYAVFYILPFLCDALMLNFNLPHYTPHFISTLAFCHVCQPQSTKRRLVGSTTTTTAMDEKVSEEFSRTVLRMARYALLALELWEGFSESNMCYMRADVNTRLLLAYVLSLARLNLLLSPVAWVCWASQYLSTCLIPGNIVTQVLLILTGLASIRLSSKVQSENSR